MTGQQDISSLNDLNAGPAAAKRKEGVRVCHGVGGRPNEVGMQFRPNLEGYFFKPGHGPKFGVPDLLDGQKLTPEQPVSEVVCVQLETIAEWGMSLEIEGFDTPASLWSLSPQIQTLTFGGMALCCLKAWRTCLVKKGVPTTLLLAWSCTTALLKAKTAIVRAAIGSIGIPLWPVIRGVRTGCASPSISLIHVVLQGSHTTRDFQSILSCMNGFDFGSLLYHDATFPGKRSEIQTLTVCSRDSFPVWSQYAHSFTVFFTTLVQDSDSVDPHS